MKLIATLALLGSALLLNSCGSCEDCKNGVCAAEAVAAPVPHISLKDLQAAVAAKSAILVDARAGSKWDNGERIPGAIGLSLEADAAAIAAALPDKSAAIVTYCGSEKCPMSDMMAKKLQGLGYAKVSEFKPGIAGWKSSGGQVIK
ncbi:MAG: hypothetical protein RL095_4108 [Verrucomicrobiota bacterium]